MPGWAWSSPINKAALEAMNESRAYVLDALLVSETLVACGFTIGILANQIGFTVGKQIVRLLCEMCVFLGPKTGYLVGWIIGSTMGSISSLTVGGLTVSNLVYGSLLGGFMGTAIGGVALMSRWKMVVGLMRLIDEIVGIADTVTISALTFSGTVTKLSLRAVHQAMHLSEHLSLASVVQRILTSACSELMQPETIEACRFIGDMSLTFCGQTLEGTRVPEMWSALCAIAKLHSSGALWVDPGGVTTTLGHLPDAAEIRRYVRFSLATYGQLRLKFLGVVPYGAASSDEAAFYHCVGGTKRGASIVLAEWTGRVLRPGYVIAVDSDRRAIVLALRGSVELQDALTDLCCEHEECEAMGLRGIAHSGMWKSATRISEIVRLATVFQGCLP